MKKDNIIELVQPGEFKDHLTEVLRQGAQALVLQAVEAEFAAFLVLSRLRRVAEERRRMSDLWTDYAIRAAKLLKAN